MSKTIVTAHSGCEDTPRDSMESIDAALRLGADAIEVDVRVDEKGDLRISHNAVLQTEYETKPRFSDVLEKIRDTQLKLNCDVKEPAALYALLREAKQYGFTRDRLILTGCVSPEQLVRDSGIVKAARAVVNVEEVFKVLFLYHSDEFTIGMYYDLMSHPMDYLKGLFDSETMAPYIEDFIKLLKYCGADACNMPYAMLDMPVIPALKEAGIPISVWTVDDAEIVEKCLDCGVWNITTRKVQQALEVKSGSKSD